MSVYASSLTRAHKSFLRDLFPGEDCLFEPERMVPFSMDSSRLSAIPWGVVRPRSHEQVVELLKWADTERMPIYGRARATGQAGNVVPVKGGIVVSTLGLNKIIEVDSEDFLVVTQPGVITSDLQAACEAKKLFYPPDPASVAISTIGGNVSSGAGGLKAVKYGVTRDWVLGLTAVLPGGRVLTSGGRSHKDVVGLDLKRLFVGANGKLGLITELILKLIPLPETSASVLVGFPDLDSSMRGAAAVFRAGLLPTACEFMDETTLEAIRLGDEIPVAPDARAALLFQVDGTEAGVRAEIDALTGALASLAPSSMELGRGADQEAVWAVRRAISPASYRIKPDKLSEDIAVPRSQVPAAVASAQESARRHGLPVLCFGHLGDGNIHVNVMYDAKAYGEAEAAHRIVTEVFAVTLKLGGTLSGEHGTGLTKAEFVSDQLSREQIDRMADIRRVFDPHEIMNPGKAW